MSHYILRLDDASDYMDFDKWIRMKKLLDKYDIKPLFGIIPKNADKSIITKYSQNPKFWNLMNSWIKNGWIPAMHGYEHKYETQNGGINPVNMRSEFAELPYEIQAEKIRNGYQILVDHGIKANVFFAPSHTFDKNTLRAIKQETPIRIISDTIATDSYSRYGFTFVPQQAGRMRKLPFPTVTFCYHPNTMQNADFEYLEDFLQANKNRFITFPLEESKRRYSMIDKLLQCLYMRKHRR